MRKHSAWKLVLSTLLQLAAAQEVARGQASPLFTISGVTHDASGRKVGGVKVCAMPETTVYGELFPCALSDAEGKFLIHVGKPGEFRLMTEKVEEGYMPQSLPFFMQPEFPAQKVTLDYDNAVPYVEINLGKRAGAVSAGKIVDAETGWPVEGATLVLCHITDPKVCAQTGAKNAEGKLSVRTPLVPFTVTVKADGYKDWHGRTAGEPAGLVLGSPREIPLTVTMKRLEAAPGSAASEAEKVAGVNLPAPAVLSPADGAVFDHFPRRTRLSWKAVEGAVSYAVEVDYCVDWRPGGPDCADPRPLNSIVSNNPPTTRITTTSYEFNFVGAQPGRWRVWAVDREGRAGFKSAWRGFRYTQ